MSKEPGRNDSCPCGSGKKYKYCCLDRGGVEYNQEFETLELDELEELMQKGYVLKEESEKHEAADCWLKVWERVKEMAGPKIRKPRDLDNRISTSQSVFNWAQDLEQCLHNAGINNDKYLWKQIRYADEFCELFPDTKPSVLVNRRKAAAEACFHLGRVEEGEQRFGRLVEDHPESPWIYINWGDMYSLHRRHDKVPHDPARSRELYEKARPHLDRFGRNAVENRLNDLNQESV